jgi:hypothetical protein
VGDRRGAASAQQQAAALIALQEKLAAEVEALRQAREADPYVTYQGASNFPTDPSVWVTDWRENLPPEHPERYVGPPLAGPDSAEATERVAAANRALRRAARISRARS